MYAGERTIHDAKAGVPAAQVELGLICATGDESDRDYVQAHMWFNLAAALGDGNAKALREALTDEMSPQDVREALRRARAWRPDADQTLPPGVAH